MFRKLVSSDMAAAALLLWWLAHETPLGRVQTAVVIGIAAVIELVFSGWLDGQAPLLLLRRCFFFFFGCEC